MLLALLAGLLVGLLMRAITGLLQTYTNRHETRRAQVRYRLLIYTLHLFTGMLSVLATLGVLYLVGDWILLGASSLLLLAFSIRIKEWLPRFIGETRLLLNLGSVREGERLIHNGIPWRVKNINLHSTLENPCLRGGKLRMSLAQLARLHSRVEGPDEPLFPCEEGHWLFFDDGIHAKVMLQTPEVVHLRTAGGTIHYMDTQKLLKARPMNFSLGSYGVIFNLAIDTCHVGMCTDESFPIALDHAIRTKFAGRRAGDFLLNTLIEFKEPSLNALNFLVRVDMDSGIDDDYYHVKRLANAACVEACNELGIRLAIHQVAIHHNQLPTDQLA